MRHWIKTLGMIGGVGFIGFGLLGCELLSQRSVSLPNPSQTSPAQTSPAQTSTLQTDASQTNTPQTDASQTQPNSKDDQGSDALQAEPLQAQPSAKDDQTQDHPTKDYQKSSVLQVGSLSELKGDTTCQGTGGTLVYAETQNYRVYICGDKNDRLQPRYYRSRDRDGSGGINLEAKTYDPRQMRYFEFKNNGYSYILQIPSGQIPDPELNVELPNRKLVGEKVLRYLAKP